MSERPQVMTGDVYFGVDLFELYFVYAEPRQAPLGSIDALDL